MTVYPIAGFFTDADKDEITIYLTMKIEGEVVPGWIDYDQTQSLFKFSPKIEDVRMYNVTVICTDGYVDNKYDLILEVYNYAPRMIDNETALPVQEFHVKKFFMYEIPQRLFVDEENDEILFRLF